MKCPDCDEEKHLYWWDCEGLPKVFWNILNHRPRRTHGVIFKGEGWGYSEDYKQDKSQDGE